MSMAKIKLVCDNCGKSFLRENGEYNRSVRCGRTHFYCSRVCGSTNPENLERLRFNQEKIKRSISGLRSDNRRDDYTPYRTHLRRVRRRKRDHDVELSDLKQQWDKQQGKCPYTKVLLVLDESSNPNYQASLDRVDSSRGYVRGNIQWISVTANLAKCGMSNERMFEFVNLIQGGKK